MTTPPRQLPYAPTPYSYLPNPALTATISLDEVRAAMRPRMSNSSQPFTYQEVKLSTTAAQRDLYDSLAEIYSIIITLDGLEKAYIRDSVPESEYTELCGRLLNQYKSILKDDTVSREFVDLDSFKSKWDVSNPSRHRDEPGSKMKPTQRV